MTNKTINIDIVAKQGLNATISISMGTHQIQYDVPILCPNQDKDDQPHYVVLNGRDTNTKEKYQQFWCKSCFNSFYVHTSKIFNEFEIDIKNVIENVLKGGRIKISELAARLKMNNSRASKLLADILKAIIKYVKNYKNFLKKRRRSSTLFVDETFLKIHGKTWYIIVVISGNNKIMDVRLVKHRSKEVMLEIIKSCEKRLLYGLKMLITDGFSVYKGVALDIGHPLIHVRHIHKPPFGRIEFDIYEYFGDNVKIITGKTTNEITKVNGFFFVRVSEKVVKKERAKPGRKCGCKNRPREVIEAERTHKNENKKKRGRPEGVKNSTKNEEFHVFFHDKKGGCIEQRGDSSVKVEAALNKILLQFPDKYITTNPVEKEFSVLKKLICFRGRRSVETWMNLLIAYYSIRDDPKILKRALKMMKITSRTVINSLFSIIKVGVLVN